MPQLTNLRLLLSYANYQTSSPKFSSTFSSFSLFFKPKTSAAALRHRFTFTAFSYSSRQRPRSLPLNLNRMNRSSLTEEEKGEKQVEMEESGSIGFNKKRAEGRDNGDRPKKVLKLKDAKLNPVNTICYLQIMGTGMDTQDTSPSVLLFFDKQRFIFNAGEGLQRFCTEHKIKLSKIDHIFLSRVCSETAGGLPGLLLTLAGIGDEGMSVNVWGPSDLNYLVDAMRSFIPGAAMVHTHSFETRTLSDPIIVVDNEVVKISAILLRPNFSEQFGIKNGEETSLFTTKMDLKGTKDQSLQPVLPQNGKSEAQVVSKPGDISILYICELPEIKGKFDKKKALALGLRPGPKYRELQLGQSVKSDRQDIMVHPSDVLDPSIPGPIVLVVDCPTTSHLQELISMESLKNYYGDISDNPGKTSKIVNCIIHSSPASVVNTREYQTWMARFVGAQHIMAGHQMKNIEVPILKSSARIAARLNYICPQFFPSPGFWSLQQHVASDSNTSNQGSCSELCQTISAENLLKFRLRPYTQLGIDRSGVPSLASAFDVINELFSEIPEIEDAAKQIAGFWHQSKCMQGKMAPAHDGKVMIEEPCLNEDALPSCLQDISREEMEIVLLGTGSSQPSKYRNVSAVFINLFSKGSLLFDCGEGTLGQLKRRFGLQGADDAIRGLRCIWISHIHADHHTGLARILALRRDLLKGVPHEPLFVIGPRQLKRYLDAYQRLEDLDMQFLDCRHTTEDSLDAFESNNMHSAPGSPSNHDIDSTLFARGSPMQIYWKRPNSPLNTGIAFSIFNNLKSVLIDAGLEALISFPVVHCPQAYGVVLKAAERVNSDGKSIPGWKIVYSGDTRPCPELVKASHGATVLIHEATFEDGMVDEAIARNHSTTKEAIEVGDSARAYRIILTHFSQRYPKIPVFDETHMHKTCIAFDLMSINLADLPMLPKVLPYLKLLFRDEMIVDESDDIVDAVNLAN